MKKFFAIFTIVAVVAVTSFNVYSSINKNVQLFDTMLANVEALAYWGENDDFLFYLHPCPGVYGNECSMTTSPIGCHSSTYCP